MAQRNARAPCRGLQQRRPVSGNPALLKCLSKRRGSGDSSGLSLWWENTSGNTSFVSSLLFLFGFVLYSVAIHLFSGRDTGPFHPPVLRVMQRNIKAQPAAGTEAGRAACHCQRASAAPAMGRDVRPLAQPVINSLTAALELSVSSLQPCKPRRFLAQEVRPRKRGGKQGDAMTGPGPLTLQSHRGYQASLLQRLLPCAQSCVCLIRLQDQDLVSMIQVITNHVGRHNVVLGNHSSIVTQQRYRLCSPC